VCAEHYGLKEQWNTAVLKDWKEWGESAVHTNVTFADVLKPQENFDSLFKEVVVEHFKEELSKEDHNSASVVVGEEVPWEDNKEEKKPRPVYADWMG
jgi:hypothetical protein